MTTTKMIAAGMAALFGLTSALPKGAPGCNVMAAMKMGGESQPLGYELVVPESYTAGQPMEISISNANEETYKGILIYAETAADAKIYAGSFELPADHKSNADVCRDDFGITCDDNCAITHTSEADKPLPSLMLNIPEDVGDVKVQCAIVRNGKEDWQILEPAMVPSAGGGDLEAGQGDLMPPPGGDCNCAPVKKCKKWKNGGSAAAPPAAPPAPDAPVDDAGPPAEQEAEGSNPDPDGAAEGEYEGDDAGATEATGGTDTTSADSTAAGDSVEGTIEALSADAQGLKPVLVSSLVTMFASVLLF